MADNFNMKQFLMENKLGAYSRLKEEKSNKQKLIDAGYSESDAEDFADEFEQGGNKVPQKVKDILTGKGKKEGYMGTQYDSSEDMAVDMVKKGITEKEEDYLVKGDNQVIVRIGDSVETLEGIFDQMMAMPTKNIRGLAEYGHQTLQDIKQILKMKEGKEESLNEYEKPYYYIKDGVCYRATDEGYVDEVDMSYCRRYAEGKEEEKEQFAGINEAGMFATKANINPELVDKIERFVKGVSKAYGYSVDDAYTNIMSVLKGGLSKKEESLNEVLSPQAYERMDGLVSITGMRNILNSAAQVIRELEDEGFEDDEIFDFIMSKIKTLG